MMMGGKVMNGGVNRKEGEKLPDVSSEPATIQIVHHHYLPIRGWLFQKGNYVMVQFQASVPDEEIASAFASPSKSTTIDTALVDHLKTMAKGQAIKLPKDDSITPRSLKVRVNKAAVQAGRKLEWAEVSDGFIARVILITSPSANGQVANSTPAEAPAEAEVASTRNRR
jgi:hypothetical protein